MKTVGTILREARIARGLKESDIEKAIKIREKYIRAIEADSFQLLPSPSYAKGFVRNYASYLGLSTESIMAFFRRQMTDVSRASILPKGVSEPLNNQGLKLTPGRFVGILVTILVAIFLLYLGGQYLKISTAPPLSISNPQNNAITSDSRVIVEGKTDSDATVTINGVSTIVRDDGTFYDRVAVEPGVNTITIISTSRFGKITTVKRQVGYQAP